MGSMGTPHTFIDPVTSEEITVISEATAVDFSGHVDGVNLEIDDIAPGYSDLGSEIGDIIIIRPTTQWGDNVADVLDVSHENDGTLKDDTVDTDQLVDGAVESDKIADGGVTAVKMATPPSRFVPVTPVQVVSADPANTNFTGVDLTAQTSPTAYAALLSVSMASGGAGNYTGQVRKTGTTDTIIVVTNPSLAGPFVASTIVGLDASQSFDWAASNAAVTNITITLLGYYELVA